MIPSVCGWSWSKSSTGPSRVFLIHVALFPQTITYLLSLCNTLPFSTLGPWVTLSSKLPPQNLAELWIGFWPISFFSYYFSLSFKDLRKAWLLVSDIIMNIILRQEWEGDKRWKVRDEGEQVIVIPTWQMCPRASKSIWVALWNVTSFTQKSLICQH